MMPWLRPPRLEYLRAVLATGEGSYRLIDLL